MLKNNTKFWRYSRMLLTFACSSISAFHSSKNVLPSVLLPEASYSLSNKAFLRSFAFSSFSFMRRWRLSVAVSRTTSSLTDSVDPPSDVSEMTQNQTTQTQTFTLAPNMKLTANSFLRQICDIYCDFLSIPLTFPDR